MRIFLHLATPELWININKIFYWNNAPQGHSKNRVFQNNIFGIPNFQKSYPQKVPNPPNYSRRKLFEIQDSFGVRNTVFQKDTPQRITKNRGTPILTIRYTINSQRGRCPSGTKCRRMGKAGTKYRTYAANKKRPRKCEAFYKISFY